MRRRDPIASPTLAQLYVEQGHYSKAKGVLDTVLAQAPNQGQALALRERLALMHGGTLTLHRRFGAIDLRWRQISDPDRQHVILMWIRGPEAAPEMMVRSFRCGDAAGGRRVQGGAGPASFCAAIGHVDPAHGFVTVAVAESLSW